MSHISFFVSSTFKDMQGERDALHRVIIPEIRELAESYGRSVDFIDLRWGISTDDLEGDGSSGKILSVCLDEIEECSPYQIVILGERYGWMPSQQLLRETADRKKFTLEDYRISVTELEIQYGMWVNQGMLDHCIFCLRDPIDPEQLSEEERKIYLTEDKDDQERMRKLKEKITNNPGIHVIHYSVDMKQPKGIYDEFSQKLSTRLHEILEKEWGEQKKKSWIQREFEEEKLMSVQLAERFSAREFELQTLEEHVTCKFVVATGADGCGMSSIMAKLGERLDKKGFRAVNIYCGNGFCGNTEQLLKIMCAHILGSEAEEEFQRIEPGFGAIDFWKEKWDETAAAYDGENICFLIDGIHHLDIDQALEKSKFLPSKGCSDKISFVITTNQEVELYPLAVEQVGRWCDFYGIETCTESELRRIITSRLKAEHKQIGEPVMKALLEHPLIGNMLCLELILQDILNLDHVDFEEIHKLEQSMDGNEAISQYLCEAIRKHPKTEIKLINHWFHRSVSILAEHKKEEINYLYYMLSCLAGAMNGLSVNELSDMFEHIKNSGRTSDEYWLNWWEEIRFVKLRRYLGKMLQKKADGRYVFAHEQIRSAIFAFAPMAKLASGPMVYYKNLPDESEFKQENLLPSFLLFITGKTEKELKKYENIYFFDYIKRMYEMLQSEDEDKAGNARRALGRMAKGLRKSVVYGDGELRVQTLCNMLRRKAAAGIAPSEAEIDFFNGKLAHSINKSSIYEKSVVLAYWVALGQGYEQWEAEDENYARPSVKNNRNYMINHTNMGRYCQWNDLQRRCLTEIYTKACETYHELQVCMDSNMRIIKPEWTRTEVRAKAAFYLNVFSENTGLLRQYLCNRIILMDADHMLLSNPGQAVCSIEDSELYNKRLIKGRVHSGQQHLIRWYVESMMNTVQSYITITRAVEEIADERRIKELRTRAVAHCVTMIDKLKWKRYIKEPLDLEPALRIKYFSTLYHAKYYSNKEKQSYVDDLWELQKTFRSQKEWMRDKATRDQIMKNAVILMEILLQGYMPGCFRSKQEYALRLISDEGCYMLAWGQAQNLPESIYYLYLIRAMFTIECQEREPETAKADNDASATSLKSILEQWQNADGEYIFKLKWLLKWHEGFVAQL